MKYYGLLTNRMYEEANEPKEIVVGMGATEIFYSDRHAYEVIEVKDQKHITVRQMKAKCKEAYTNNWELTSDEDATPIELTKRKNGWYTTSTITREDIEALGIYKDEDGKWTADNHDNLRTLWHLLMHGYDIEKILAKGKQTHYNKRNFYIGIADEHYDYSF